MIALLQSADFHPLLTTGENIQCGCPFAPYTTGHKHDRDRKPSMGLLVGDDDFEPTLINCFTCHWSSGQRRTEDTEVGVHRLFATLARHDSNRWSQYVERAAEIEQVDMEAMFGSVATTGYTRNTLRKSARPIEEGEWLPFRFGCEEALPYLSSRGVDPRTATLWGVGYDSVERRVMIPVRSPEGTLLGAVGRAIDSRNKLAYKNYWNFDRRYAVLGAHMIKGRVAVVCEGTLDPIVLSAHLGEAGLLDTHWPVSTMGTEATRQQVDVLVRTSSSLLIAFDNDKAGMSGRSRLIRMIGGRLPVFAVRYEANMRGEDPASLAGRMVPLIRRPVVVSD